MHAETKDKKLFVRKLITVILLVLAGLLVLLGFALFVTERWLFQTWAALAMDEILYHLSTSVQGTNPEMIQTYIFHYGIFAVLAVMAYIVSVIVLRKRKIGRMIVVFAWIAISLALIDFVYYDVDRHIGLGEYFREITAPEKERSGDFIYDEFVDPQTVEITFPEKKRNLIYIFLESMEMTYADEKNGGAFEKNVIPELTKLGTANEDFSGNSKKLNGAVSLPGTTWTMGAMFGQSTGVPLKLPISGLQVESQIDTDFFPGLTAIGDVLQNEGYHQVLLIGSDASFGGREVFFSTHGKFDIHDYYYARKNGLIPEKYFVFWGYEDERLFSFAKDELKALAEKDEPFNLTMLTVDTHFEDGYVCNLCGDTFGDNQYANVMACSSKQIGAFVEWIQKQDFYENTTIVICGDHPTMDTDFCKDVPKTYQRRTFTTIINGAAEPVNPDWERLYSTMDMYPTTLASLGATIKGNRLGLGTDLYSLKETILEKYGVEACTTELDKPSKFMDSFSNVTITEETMEAAKKYAKLTYKVEDNGKVTFTINYANAISSSTIKSAVLELTDTAGNVTTVKMEIVQPKSDPNVHWCIGKTDLTESDLYGMKAEVFYTVGDFEHYSMAKWPN